MDIKNFTLPELKDYIRSLDEKHFRADQIYEWIHQKLVLSYDEMQNIPKGLRDTLKKEHPIFNAHLFREQTSHVDGRKKFLYGLKDGEGVETVLMKYEHGNSLCISSQAGCAMGCSFCASTRNGLVRSLETSELLDQVYSTERITGRRISNIVVMGTGEPLDNYDNLVRFIRIITDEKGRNISGRNITVSTCGIVPNIYRLAEEGFALTLAISLHSAFDDKRSEIMPINRKYPLDELIKAVSYYGEKTGRRITFEYSLIHGVNDSNEDADALKGLAKRVKAHINLIPVNPVTEVPNMLPPDKSHVYAFQNRLEKNGINVTIRREMGRDIDGACGQLRLRHLDTK